MKGSLSVAPNFIGAIELDKVSAYTKIDATRVTLQFKALARARLKSQSVKGSIP